MTSQSIGKVNILSSTRRNDLKKMQNAGSVYEVYEMKGMPDPTGDCHVLFSPPQCAHFELRCAA